MLIKSSPESGSSQCGWFEADPHIYHTVLSYIHLIYWALLLPDADLLPALHSKCACTSAACQDCYLMWIRVQSSSSSMRQQYRQINQVHLPHDVSWMLCLNQRFNRRNRLRRIWFKYIALQVNCPCMCLLMLYLMWFGGLVSSGHRPMMVGNTVINKLFQFFYAGSYQDHRYKKINNKLCQ